MLEIARFSLALTLPSVAAYSQTRVVLTKIDVRRSKLMRSLAYAEVSAENRRACFWPSQELRVYVERTP